MKQNPKEQALRDNLAAGALTKEGFLGEDTRSLEAIILDDMNELSARGLTCDQLAAAMRELTKQGLEGMGAPVEHNGYLVVVEDYMGWIGCPFRDNRRAAKRVTRATDQKTGKEMTWTDLALHIITAHGFFQGVGSPYRLEPMQLADFLRFA